MRTKNIAIIGAGFTGLTAAYELAKQGFAVTIFEKSDDIGGLAGGFLLEGAPLEKAYHHLFRTDTDILSLLEELGMQDEIHWFPSKIGMIVEGSTQSTVQYENKPVNDHVTFKILPFNGVKDLLIYQPLPFFDRIRAGIVLFFLQKYSNWKTLISTTAMSWMTKWAGARVMTAIWGPLLSGKFANYASKVSMAWLWARIHTRANSRKSIFAKELLAYPRRGFISIAEKLAEKTAEFQKLPKDQVVKTSARIEGISPANDTITITIEGKTLVFDAVLSTIPQQAFTKLIATPALATDLAKLASSPIDYLGAVVLTFSSPQSLSAQYWHNIIVKDAPFLVFLQHTNLVPRSWYNNKNVYYIGVYLPQNHQYFTDPNCTDNVIKDEWFTFLNKLFPSFDPTQISEVRLFKFPFAQHVVDTTYPEEIPLYQTIYPHIFSANFSQIFPEDRGTNYAVREGRKIAALIAEDLLQ
jgi:protoporphyrinogen oxidase